MSFKFPWLFFARGRIPFFVGSPQFAENFIAAVFAQSPLIPRR
jgi:hypothetical protein